MRDSLRRLAPLSGIVFAAMLVVVFFFTPGTVKVHDTGVQVVAPYRLHHSAIVLGNFCGAVGVVFFIFFVGSLRSYMRGHDGGEDLSTVAFGGALLIATGGAIFVSLEWALSDARNSISPAAAEALNVLNNNFFGRLRSAWSFSPGRLALRSSQRRPCQSGLAGSPSSSGSWALRPSASSASSQS